jgi:hypothetical protein
MQSLNKTTSNKYMNITQTSTELNYSFNNNLQNNNYNNNNYNNNITFQNNNISNNLIYSQNRSGGGHGSPF